MTSLPMHSVVLLHHDRRPSTTAPIDTTQRDAVPVGVAARDVPRQDTACVAKSTDGGFGAPLVQRRRRVVVPLENGQGGARNYKM